MRKTLSALTLSLGVAGCDPPAPVAMFHTDPVVSDAGLAVCPVISGISSGSLEAPLGGEIELEAFASSTRDEMSFRWSGGRFEPPDAAATRYVCVVPGDSTLSVALATPECPEVAQRLSVTCTGERCSDCLRAASPSDLVTRCIGGAYFDRANSERCVDALLCSLSAPDACTSDPDAGALACYCGALSREECAPSGRAERSPAGACAAAWEAAAGCKSGDARCVLARLLDLGRPSGIAYAALRLLAGDCREACRLSP
jgi:hypothetical protein